MPQNILDRLTSQLMAKGMEHSKAHATAVESLQKNGIFHPGTTTLTTYGAQRNAMSPAQRAASRAAKASGGKHSPNEYGYNHKTNMATLKNAK